MTDKLEQLKTQVASLKAQGTILKVKDLEGQAFLMEVSSTTTVNGQYGEQLLIVGNYTQGDLNHKAGDNLRLYLNGARRTKFEEAGEGPGEYGFVFGASVTLKSGHDYIPLELVTKA